MNLKANLKIAERLFKIDKEIGEIKPEKNNFKF